MLYVSKDFIFLRFTHDMRCPDGCWLNNATCFTFATWCVYRAWIMVARICRVSRTYQDAETSLLLLGQCRPPEFYFVSLPVYFEHWDSNCEPWRGYENKPSYDFCGGAKRLFRLFMYSCLRYYQILGTAISISNRTLPIPSDLEERYSQFLLKQRNAQLRPMVEIWYTEQLLCVNSAKTGGLRDQIFRGDH